MSYYIEQNKFLYSVSYTQEAGRGGEGKERERSHHIWLWPLGFHGWDGLILLVFELYVLSWVRGSLTSSVLVPLIIIWGLQISNNGDPKSFPPYFTQKQSDRLNTRLLLGTMQVGHAWKAIKGSRFLKSSSLDISGVEGHGDGSLPQYQQLMKSGSQTTGLSLLVWIKYGWLCMETWHSDMPRRLW